MTSVIFNSGLIGFIIWLLLFAVSTAALALILRCAWSLRKAVFLTPIFKQESKRYLEQQDWQSAFDYCQKFPSMLGAAVISEILLSAETRDSAGCQEAASAVIDRRVRNVLRQISSLSMCANIAPMLGLLGTVTGMVDAFTGLGTAMGPEKASILAIAISQALYTTAAGLLAAIPAITFSVIFRNLLEKRIESVTDLSNFVIEKISRSHYEEPDAGEYQCAVYHDTTTMKL
ncbi:MAG: MotA/TolQ/ExbB proton channel family protein [Lentisphaeria bacterium]|nr:MotA/TolQ/ExbB proton channel family protein [Lentisphaeria bacterium]